MKHTEISLIIRMTEFHESTHVKQKFKTVLYGQFVINFINENKSHDKTNDKPVKYMKFTVNKISIQFQICKRI